MVQVLCEGGLGFVAMVEYFVGSGSGSGSSSSPSSSPRRSCVQPSRIVAATSNGAPVQDATAAPPVRRDSYQLAPRSLALKTRKARKRGPGGRSNGAGDDGGDITGGSSWGGGGSDWGSGGSGSGGWESWGESWNDDIRRWNESRDAFALLYQAACWLSLSNCVHYVLTLAFRCPSVYTMWFSVLGVYVTISLSKCVHNVLSLLP